MEFGWKHSCIYVGGMILQCTWLGTLFRSLPVIDNTEMIATKKEETPVIAAEVISLNANGERVDSPPSRTRQDGARTSRSKHSLNKQLTSITSINSQGTPHGHQLKAHVPLHRKDVFYSGSLRNIPLYDQNRTTYVASNMSLASALHQTRRPAVIEPSEKSSGICSPEFTAALKETVDFTLLRDWGFLVFLLSNLFTNFGFNAPYLFITGRATDYGLSVNQGKTILSTVGIANTIGRVVFGFVADLPRIKPHRLYLYNVGLLIAGLATVFSFAQSFAAQMVYAATYGVFIGKSVEIYEEARVSRYPIMLYPSTYSTIQ